MHIHIHIHTHLHLNIHIHTHTHAHTHTHIHIHTHTHTHTHIHIHTHTYIYAHTYTHTHTHTHIHKHVYIYIIAPKDLCDGAKDARKLAEDILNNTVTATPPPPTPRPSCVCTPQAAKKIWKVLCIEPLYSTCTRPLTFQNINIWQGCDCLGQYPRLRIEAGSSVRANWGALVASILTGLAYAALFT